MAEILLLAAACAFVSDGTGFAQSSVYSPVARWPSFTRTSSAPRAPAGDSRSVLSAAPNIAKPTPTRRATFVPFTGLRARSSAAPIVWPSNRAAPNMPLALSLCT
jgi:hypothetical protein